MHMLAAKLFKHKQADKCNNATEKRLRRRDVEMAERCGDIEFSLEGREVDDRVEVVATFRCPGSTLDQTHDDYLAMRRNIMREMLVWCILGTLLRREGADPRVVEMFYRGWSKQYYFIVQKSGSFRCQWIERYKGHT